MSIDTKGAALVTGGSAGIGAVYADRLAHRGYDLVLVARNAAKLAAIADRLRAKTGRSIEGVVADLGNRPDLATIEHRLATDASITMLVNNAGISLPGGLLESEPAALEALIATNITAPTVLAAAAAKAFVARKAAGTIINIGSVLALAPELMEGVYSGSKAYLLNLTLKLALDVKGSGIRVQAVLPGATRTDIWERSGMDPDAMMPGMVMEAGDLVDAALVGLDKGEIVTIPPLPDETQWTDYEAARLALAPNLSRKEVAARYRRAGA